eukprot:TRINITY_DN17320_c0_g1_i1.p1 TRINITY_DN17320_c0_g1~~TRINITY_DN17320_c0_g1_i1.p1  ORF type:complete len:154 (+),score=28.80 TRINITY_DN17320_c0_g1_i1:342-803(+)
MDKMNKVEQGKKELWRFTENLLVKLPLVQSRDHGKIGPAVGFGIGCGVGLGAGLFTGAGPTVGIHGMPFRIGAGAGCGLGLGIGYGAGRGWAKDENGNHNNVQRLFKKGRNGERVEISLDEFITTMMNDLINSTTKACEAIAREIEKRSGGPR